MNNVFDMSCNFNFLSLFISLYKEEELEFFSKSMLFHRYFLILTIFHYIILNLNFILFIEISQKHLHFISWKGNIFWTSFNFLHCMFRCVFPSGILISFPSLYIFHQSHAWIVKLVCIKYSQLPITNLSLKSFLFRSLRNQNLIEY